MPKKAAATQDEPASTPAATELAEPAKSPSGRYTVVARRYRPLDFDQLIGQQTVATALQSAIQSDRVGHAYLFTGARGVGKTSTARIFAKALNLSKLQKNGESKADKKLNDADIAGSIDSGEDIDVIEIDGASNRGIEEIRQLRANATVRPARSPYKIYIIDEVHMLTIAAFNALLKTLEEPPPHVKFIFCTTDPEKIPITVLSRCQRFDFVPIKTDEIQNRLAQICEIEKVKADNEALRLIARRANGSMRDSQSLLEQLLSFSSGQITVSLVHSMLGTADDSRLEQCTTALIDRNAADALRLLDEAVEAGVDAGQLGEQLLGYLRDLMTIGVGASAELMRYANPADAVKLKAAADRWGTMTLLAAIQILDESLVKMRQSVQSRILLEVALVQICHLQDLQSLANLAAAIRADASLPQVLPPRESVSATNSSAEKKKVAAEAEQFVPVEAVREIADEPESERPAAIVMPTEIASPLTLWRTATANCEGMLSECAAMAIEVIADEKSKTWEIILPAGSEFALQIFNEPENLRLLQNSLVQQQGMQRQLKFRTAPASAAAAGIRTDTQARPTRMNQNQLMRHANTNSFILSLTQSLDAEVVRVDVPSDWTPESSQ